MADTEISDLSAETTPTSDDLTVLVNDPGGTPGSRKVTLANLMALFANPVSDDGDSLGTTSLKWSDIFLAEGAVINFDSGDMTLTQAENVLTIAGGTLKTAPGTTAEAPLVIDPTGSLKTTPAAGDIEMDANNLYATTDAGNRGVVPIIHFFRAAADQTLTNTGSAQAIFDSPANGTITLEAGTYFFVGLLLFTGMSATSGNAEITWAGAATYADVMWYGQGLDNSTVSTIGDDDSAFVQSTTGHAASMFVAGTGTAMRARIEGSFEISAGGTVIPSITLVTAIAAILESGSYLYLWRAGSTSVTSVGQTS